MILLFSKLCAKVESNLPRSGGEITKKAAGVAQAGVDYNSPVLAVGRSQYGAGDRVPSEGTIHIIVSLDRENETGDVAPKRKGWPTYPKDARKVQVV